MKLTFENYKEYVPSKDQSLMQALLNDLNELNSLTKDKELFIEYQDYHNEYSPERTDPCPDYYGTYTLRFEDDPHNTLCCEMTIQDLDLVLCSLISFAKYK